MRIALTITELDPGGAERCLARLAVYLHKRGHDVRVFAFGPKPVAGQSVITDILDDGGARWEVAGLGPSRGVSQMVRGCKAVYWLRRKLKEFSPDVVQSMLFHADCITALALPKSTGVFLGGARVSDPSRARAAIHRYACKKMQRIVCVSRSVADHLASTERIATDKLVVIPNGVELPGLADREVDGLWERESIGPRVLLSVGRLFPQKGYANYLQSLPKLLDSLPEHHVVIVGEGPLRPQLEGIISLMPCADRVHLLGWRADVPDLLRHSEMLVLPSEYEGMPNVVLEAMAAQKPFVAFDVDGLQEILKPAQQSTESDLSGLQMAPKGNYTVLHDRIEALAGENQLRQQCGVWNRALVEREFALEKQFAKYEALYEHLLEQ